MKTDMFGPNHSEQMRVPSWRHGFGRILPRVLAVAALVLAPGRLPAAGVLPGPGLPELYRVDQLPSLRGSTQVAMISSYDRTGGNDDGFSGKYSFLREENGGLVIADLKGPGAIYRIWTPTPTDDWVEFYFDGEAVPRIRVKFRELFLGKQPPFVVPLVGYGAGGFYSYVPLPFRQSCKILVRAKRVQFYQINYARYDATTPIASFNPNTSPDYLEQQDRARKLLLATGSDISGQVVPTGQSNQVIKSHVKLVPGEATTLAVFDKPGRVAGLRLSPASALAGKNRDVVLRIAFDGQNPAVLCPAGDFFGYAWGKPAMKSLLVGVSGDTAYCYFPMPFQRDARVELVSERTAGEPVELAAEVVYNPTPKSAAEGYFFASWRRENPTTEGLPFTFLKTQGRGHLVGVILQAQGFESGKTLFFEGDDQTTIDGELAIHGTGSEDFFNGGWYDVPDRWEKRISFPLSGCLAYQKHLGRTGAYRLFLADAYSYQRSLLQTIEHSGAGNNIPTDYCAVTFFYAADRPAESVTLAPVNMRKVTDPKEVIFPAWWQIPIHAFSFNKASLERQMEKFDKEDVRFLSLKAAGEDWFGPPFLALTCDVPAAGNYDISIEAIRGPAQGRVQLFQNEVPVNAPVDLYQEARAKSGRIKLGTLTLEEGNHNLMFKLVGKPEQASAFALDLVQVICSKVD